jgi:putative membrane protein
MKRSTRLLSRSSFAATALALALGTAWAQGSSTGTGSTGSGAGTSARTTAQQGQKMERTDRRFIEDTVANGLFEQQAAQMAITQASDGAVKDYAGMMADMHSVANRELMDLAASKGLELPLAPPRAKRRELEQLGKKTGAEFDQEFVRKIAIYEHEKDIKRFRDASKEVKDLQLKAWIDKTLPALEQHLAQAQKLPQAQPGSAGLGGGSTSTSGGSRSDK